MTAKTTVIGTPGAHASHLGRRHLLRCAAGAAGVAGGILIALAGLGHPGYGAAALIGLGVALAGSYLAQQAWVKAQKAFAGARSERRVGAVLNGLGARTVLHGTMLGAGGDADHVVLGPILAVVETKTGRGPVRATGGRLVVNGRKLPGDPVGQAKRQAAAAGKRARRHAAAVVCVVDMTGAPFQSNGVTVCGLTNLTQVLGQLPRPVDPHAHQLFLQSLPSA